VPGALPPPQELLTEHDGAAERAAWRLAADGAALAAEAGLDARPLAVAADPRASLADALATVAVEHDASVLVVAERRRAWPGRLVRRSPARALVDALPCPVLVVPGTKRPGGGQHAAGAGGEGRAQRR
jgi:nucleotide-binding universal stress UspA family protein